MQVDSEGRKFGKSVGGAVWLSAHRLSPYKFFQHLFAVSDADVVKFLKMLTFLELKEIERIEASMQQPGYRPNTAQRRLAEEVTRFVHGEEGLQEVGGMQCPVSMLHACFESCHGGCWPLFVTRTNMAQRRLAGEATQSVHGEQALQEMGGMQCPVCVLTTCFASCHGESWRVWAVVLL